MKLREWLHFFNIDRYIWITVEEKSSDGKTIYRRSLPSIGNIMLSPLASREIVQAEITKTGNLWILIK